jgi:hypothetical protein
MTAEDVRSVLAQADRAKSVARDAEVMRVSIRLGRKTEWRGRCVTFGLFVDDRQADLTDGEESALYLALAIVRDQAEAEAKRLEQSVQVKD